MLNFTYTYMSNGEKVTSQIILNVTTLCTFFQYSLICQGLSYSGRVRELRVHRAACAAVYTHRQRALAAARRAPLVPSNRDKGSFYIWLLEEVTDPGKCQEKSSHSLSQGCQHSGWGGDNFLDGTAHAHQPRVLPRRARFPSSIRHSLIRQAAKRPRSQQLFAIEQLCSCSSAPQ